MREASFVCWLTESRVISKLVRGALLCAWIAGCSRSESPPAAAPAPPPSAPAAPLEFVGSEACASCHSAEAAAWRASQHAQAMQIADPNTVLASTAGGELRERDGAFALHAAGPDGRIADFPVKYTFGVAPLQQVLVELPGGRLQAYTHAWDVAAKRWFDLYPHEKLAAGDELHWTGRQQNWNHMCADCHSTDVRKRYDAANGTFDTRFAEIRVGCEACHGPGSRHVAWAGARGAGGSPGLTVSLRERRGVIWTLDPASGNSTRSAPRASDGEIEVCAQCHSRRTQIAEGYRAGAPFLDHYRPALLVPPLYYVDGQQHDEVYTWGSFLQSRMYAKGVTCSDCHEPHSDALRAQGNALCAGCHSAEKYDAPAHHFHKPGSKGSACVECHMPRATYMQIDPRRDHSLRIPRPDLSVSLGVPNACDACHHERGAKWAAAAVRKWTGREPTGFQRFAEVFHDAELERPGSVKSLAALSLDPNQPALVRASALARLQGSIDPSVAEAAERGATDPSPVVRLAAVELAAELPSAPRAAAVTPLFGDPTLAVRVAAASALAELPTERVPESLRSARVRADEEYVAAQRYAADRPEAHVNLGTFFARKERFDEAQAEFRAALALDPAFIPAYVNSADAYRAQSRDADALRVLEAARARVPATATVEFALGLTEARLEDHDATIAALERAAKLAPEEARYSYTLAIALHSFGRTPEALQLLERAARKWPTNRNVLLARATILRDSGQRDAARAAAEALARAYPGDADASALLEQLR
ncbi:MAG: tetratricopeptide repeat protein [Myxococcota bacterium]